MCIRDRFGSAAEGRLRAASDVNVAVVTRTFTPEDAVRLREPLALAHAAVDLRAMLLRADEVPAAAEAFAAKFADIRRRRFVLAGEDVLGAVVVPRGAEILRVKQVLLNLVLRTRTAYAQAVRASGAGVPSRSSSAAAQARSGPARSDRRRSRSGSRTAWALSLIHI